MPQHPLAPGRRYFDSGHSRRQYLRRRSEGAHFRFWDASVVGDIATLGWATTGQRPPIAMPGDEGSNGRPMSFGARCATASRQRITCNLSGAAAAAYHKAARLYQSRLRRWSVRLLLRIPDPWRACRCDTAYFGAQRAPERNTRNTARDPGCSLVVGADPVGSLKRISETSCRLL